MLGVVFVFFTASFYFWQRTCSTLPCTPRTWSSQERHRECISTSTGCFMACRKARRNYISPITSARNLKGDGEFKWFILPAVMDKKTLVLGGIRSCFFYTPNKQSSVNATTLAQFLLPMLDLQSFQSFKWVWESGKATHSSVFSKLSY